MRALDEFSDSVPAPRKRTAAYLRAHKLRSDASKNISLAINRGAIVDHRGSGCVDCGRISTDNEHRDYRKWWDVEPVCRSCNVKRGRANDVARIRHPIPAHRELRANHKQHIREFARMLADAVSEPDDLFLPDDFPTPRPRRHVKRRNLQIVPGPAGAIFGAAS